VATVLNLCLAFHLMVITNEPLEPKHVKFCMEIDHNEHTYKFCVKHFHVLRITNVVKTQIFEVMSDELPRLSR
jgi:hypothetical protein